MPLCSYMHHTKFVDMQVEYGLQNFCSAYYNDVMYELLNFLRDPFLNLDGFTYDIIFLI